MLKYPVAEKFVSINGEGARAGEPAVFVRFRGCNLRCPYCDTKWAYDESTPVEMMTSEEIVKFADGITNVTLTGGEPMLRKLDELVDLLMVNGHRVEIETNGSVPIARLSACANRPSFTMDYKLPSSLMEDKMIPENFSLLTKEDSVKFVVGSEEDLDRSLEIMSEYGLIGKCRIFLSPVFGAIEPRRIVDFLLRHRLNDVRVQLQLHKFIWNPEERGV